MDNIRVQMKQFFHGVNTKQYYALFVRFYIKQYWYFLRVTTKEYFTHFSEFILHNAFSRSYCKIILHISAESVSNNIDTSRVTTRQYYKIILFYKFLPNETDIVRELPPNTTFSTEDVPDNASFSLRCELILDLYSLR